MGRTIKFYKSDILLEFVLFLCIFSALIGVIFRADYLLYVVLFFITVINYRELIRSNISFFLIFAVFTGYIIMNGLCLSESELVISAIRQYIIPFIGYLAGMTICKKVHIKNILSVAVCLGVINTTAGLYEYFTQSYLLSVSHVQYLDNSAMRIAGLSGSFINFPLMLSFSVLAALYLFYEEKNVLYFITIIYNLFGILISQSRGPLVATIIGIFIYYLLSAKLYGFLNIKYIKRLLFIFGIGFILSFLIFHTTILDRTAVGSFVERIRTIVIWDNSNGDHSNATRVLIWKSMVKIFNENWIWGIGVGRTGSDLSKTIGVTESAILKRLVELGIVGTLINFFLQFYCFKRAIQYIKHLSFKEKKLHYMFVTYTIIIFVEGLVLQIDEYPSVMILMWLSLGIASSKIVI